MISLAHNNESIHIRKNWSRLLSKMVAMIIIPFQFAMLYIRRAKWVYDMNGLRHKIINKIDAYCMWKNKKFFDVNKYIYF